MASLTNQINQSTEPAETAQTSHTHAEAADMSMMAASLDSAHVEDTDDSDDENDSDAAIFDESMDMDGISGMNTAALIASVADGNSDRDKGDDELFSRYISDPSVDNRNAIVSRYVYLAEIISKRFVNRGIDYDDLFQVACIALIKAATRFDTTKGVKFVSFATPTIVGELKRHFRDKASLIRIPRRLYEIYQKVNHARDYLTQQLRRSPRVDEIADYLKIPEETILEIMESGNTYNMQSFDQSAYSDDDVELHETIGEEDATFSQIENRDFLQKSLERLNEAEREFVIQRYFNNMTQKEIAVKLGVSQMYVSRLERRVLDRFRLMLGKN